MEERIFMNEKLNLMKKLSTLKLRFPRLQSFYLVRIVQHPVRSHLKVCSAISSLPIKVGSRRTIVLRLLIEMSDGKVSASKLKSVEHQTTLDY